jgi:hypothetical protein
MVYLDTKVKWLYSCRIGPKWTEYLDPVGHVLVTRRSGRSSTYNEDM